VSGVQGSGSGDAGRGRLGVEIKQAVIDALELRLFPVMARWLAEAGVSVQDAVDLLRAAAVAEAQRSVPSGIDPESISLVSTRTGLSRRLVRKTLAGVKRQGKAALRGGHRGERVLAGWWHDTDYRDQKGRPRILQISKGTRSFEALCRTYSGERQYRTILKDLEQVGAVAILPPGDRVQALRQNYAAIGWTEVGQAAMAEQLAEHIETCLNNFGHPEGSQHWVCRRVANASVKPEYAKILVRDMRSQIEAQADSCYDALTDPQHTADPLDPRAEHISVTFYINRKRADACATSPQAGELGTGADESASATSTADSRPGKKTAKRPPKRRG
jgi:hypothetical protein